MKARAREILYELSTAVETAGSKRQKRSNNAQAPPDPNGSVGPPGHSGRDVAPSESHTLLHSEKQVEGGDERSQGKDPGEAATEVSETRAAARKRRKAGGSPNEEHAEQADVPASGPEAAVVSMSLPRLRLLKPESEMSEAGRPNGVAAVTDGGGDQGARGAGPPSLTDEEPAALAPGSPAGSDLEMLGSPLQRSREKKSKGLGRQLLRHAAERTLAAIGDHLFCQHRLSPNSSPCSCH